MSRDAFGQATFSTEETKLWDSASGGLVADRQSQIMAQIQSAMHTNRLELNVLCLIDYVSNFGCALLPAPDFFSDQHQRKEKTPVNG